MKKGECAEGSTDRAKVVFMAASKRTVFETQDTRRATIELTEEVLGRIEAITGNAWKTPNRRYTRDEVVEQLLWLGIAEYERMEKGAKAKGG